MKRLQNCALLRLAQGVSLLIFVGFFVLTGLTGVRAAEITSSIGSSPLNNQISKLPRDDSSIRFLSFTIGTGDDDVRSNSNVTASVECGSKGSPSLSLNYGTSWPNWSTHTTPLYFQQNDNITVNDIHKITIHFSPGRSGWLDTGDNWDMQSITVTYTLDNGSIGTLIQGSGDPLVRFTGGNQYWVGYRR